MLSCCVVSNSKETLVCYLAVNGQQLHFRFLFNPPKLPVISVTFGGIWLEQNFYRPVDLSPNPNQQQWRSRSWLNHFLQKIIIFNSVVAVLALGSSVANAKLITSLVVDVSTSPNLITSIVAAIHRWRRRLSVRKDRRYTFCLMVNTASDLRWRLITFISTFLL